MTWCAQACGCVGCVDTGSQIISGVTLWLPHLPPSTLCILVLLADAEVRGSPRGPALLLLAPGLQPMWLDSAFRCPWVKWVYSNSHLSAFEEAETISLHPWTPSQMQAGPSPNESAQRGLLNSKAIPSKTSELWPQPLCLERQPSWYFWMKEILIFQPRSNK